MRMELNIWPRDLRRAHMLPSETSAKSTLPKTIKPLCVGCWGSSVPPSGEAWLVFLLHPALNNDDAPVPAPAPIAPSPREKGSFCASKRDDGDFLHPARGDRLLLRTVRGMDGFPAPFEQPISTALSLREKRSLCVFNKDDGDTPVLLLTHVQAARGSRAARTCTRAGPDSASKSRRRYNVVLDISGDLPLDNTHYTHTRTRTRTHAHTHTTHTHIRTYTP